MIVSKSYPWSKAGTRLLGLIGLLSLVGTATPAVAQNMGDTLQVHGFLSQALVITDDNNFFGPSSESGGSTKFTEVGVNFSVRPHEDVLVAAQVLSRRAGGDGNSAQPKLDHGVIDYQPLSNQKRSIGIQVGRFKNPFGFYNQTRDVAFTRPSILLPQSIYFDRTRSLGLAADGFSLYTEERLPYGTVRAQAGAAIPQTDEDLERQTVPNATAVDGNPSFIGQILYEHSGGQFVGAVSAADVAADISTNTAEGKLSFKALIFSLQINKEKWSLTSEYAIRDLETSDFSNALFNQSAVGESWYIQYSRRFLENWQGFIRYDSLVTNRDDPSGRQYELSNAGPAHSQFARDWTMGLRWRVHPQVLLSAEYHYVNGTGWLPAQDNPDPDDTQRYWNMFLTQLSIRF
ncbi:hypothetical protein [Halomonas salinarum]|uniref:hypothetical protein n=1 Tax=Halomonas salinarum TaxID=1158993 RepID=UPI001ADE90FA|nr:hypothetical protein [Halomonas salinarum]